MVEERRLIKKFNEFMADSKLYFGDLDKLDKVHLTFVARVKYLTMRKLNKPTEAFLSNLKEKNFPTEELIL